MFGHRCLKFCEFFHKRSIQKLKKKMNKQIFFLLLSLTRHFRTFKLCFSLINLLHSTLKCSLLRAACTWSSARFFLLLLLYRIQQLVPMLHITYTLHPIVPCSAFLLLCCSPYEVLPSRRLPRHPPVGSDFMTSFWELAILFPVKSIWWIVYLYGKYSRLLGPNRLRHRDTSVTAIHPEN